MTSIVGWDIGGANVKATWLGRAGQEPAVRTVSLPFEIWRAKERLPEVLAAALAAVAQQPPQAMALTMTAELADVFATKREGVNFVFDSAAATFAGCPVYALSLDGAFVPLDQARHQPLDFAAANWLAAATWLARQYPDCLLVDIGSTTTDITPIIDGQVLAAGRTDLARLQAGELVYTGAVRTNLAAIIRWAPVRGRPCPVASEYFAVSGDVHLVLGHLASEDYTCPTPDGRPATVGAARARLARLVCADTEQLAAAEIDALAGYVHEQQVGQVTRGLVQVLSRLAGRCDLPVVALGLGAFLAEQAAQRLGLKVLSLGQVLDQQMSEVAPSWAAAHLLAEALGG